LELYEKLYVNPTFLDSDHGRIPCQACHGGDPADPDWQTAHRDVVRDPTYPDPEAVCGGCHEAISASAAGSLHYSLAPIFDTIEARAAIDQPQTMQVVQRAQSRHCGTCHASCGQCHVSRPDYVGGGFLSGHLFVRPSMETGCAACHGGRVFGEYTGTNTGHAADVHFTKARMTCLKCHGADEMHADGSGAANRFQAPHRPSCRSCHEKALDHTGDNPFHAQLAEDLSCQVCHALAYKNCFRCHVGTDKKGLAYFKCKETRVAFKIGRNPKRSAERDQAFVVLRHAPATPTLFDAYVPDALTRFNRLPTWKPNAPHTIGRRTPRNQSCQACHGHTDFFLGPDGMAPWEREANAGVIVPPGSLPKPLKEEA
jgi:thiosulfate/3-mercaptopyruvate sulfurtransferase